jgi:hypothetical protein
VALVIVSLMWLGAGQTRQRPAPMRMEAVLEPVTEVRATLAPSTFVYTDNPPCGDLRFDGARIPDDRRKQWSAEFRGQPLTFWDPAPPVKKRSSTVKGKDRASCGRLVIVMPKTARITRIVKEGQCPAGGWCGFAGEPVTEELSRTALVVSVVFKNWSHNQSATGTLKVFYRP